MSLTSMEIRTRTNSRPTAPTQKAIVEKAAVDLIRFSIQKPHT
jgi:hypothetical protein